MEVFDLNLDQERVLSEICLAFTEAWKENTGILHQKKSMPLPSIFIPVYLSQLSPLYNLCSWKRVDKETESSHFHVALLNDFMIKKL
jgi:hypothetical protein